jgi:hypothetical protein
MNDEPYNGEAPSQRHSPTSIAAGQSMKGKIGPLHNRIIQYLTKYRSGATDERIAFDLNLPGNTERPRRRELELMRIVTDSGRVEKTKSGRNAVIWVLA